MTTVYAVIIPNGIIIAVYAHENHADIHSRTVTGSRVLTLQVHDSLPGTVLEDIASDEWDDNGDTPVQEAERDTVRTNPGTPRSKAKSKPPETK